MATDGALFRFHGAFTKREDAYVRSGERPGTFVKPVYFRHGMKYAVLEGYPQENPGHLPVTAWQAEVEAMSPSARRYLSRTALAPRGPKLCALCGSKKNLVVDHKNGDQHDVRRGNHRWLCNACNIKKGLRDKRLGRGRRQERTLGQTMPKVGTLVKITKTKTRPRDKSKPRRKVTTLTETRRRNADTAGGGDSGGSGGGSDSGGLSLQQLQKEIEQLEQLLALYREAKKAEESWMVELRKLYGKEAGTARFDKKGIATPALRKLHDAFVAAMASWKAAAKRNPVTAVARSKTSELAAAKRLYKKFIGKPARKVTAKTTTHPAAKAAKGGKLAVAKLAMLSYLKIANARLKDGLIRFRGAARPKLLAHPGGRQYYFEGGKQNLNGIPAVAANPKCNPPAYARAGITRAGLRKMVNLGEVRELGYFERKAVEGFRPVEYFHKLGEENGKRPTLVYDPESQQMHLVGGDYRTLWNGINN